MSFFFRVTILLRTRKASTPSFVVIVANLSNCFKRATKSDIHCIALIRGGTRYFFHVDGVMPVKMMILTKSFAKKQIYLLINYSTNLACHSFVFLFRHKPIEDLEDLVELDVKDLQRNSLRVRHNGKADL